MGTDMPAINFGDIGSYSNQSIGSNVLVILNRVPPVSVTQTLYFLIERTLMPPILETTSPHSPPHEPDLYRYKKVSEHLTFGSCHCIRHSHGDSVGVASLHT